MAKAKILVVEDEAITAKDIQDGLRGLGYDAPAIAASGEGAIKKAEEIKPDLVLMDIMLKGDMDGIEAAVQIRDRFDIPVIYLTAYLDDDKLEKTKVAEPYGYITKPVVDKDLRPAIEIALQRHKREKALRESEERYRLLTESAQDYIFIIDSDIRIQYTNPFATGQTGYRPGEIIGKALEEVFPPDLSNIFKHNLQTVFESGEPLHVEDMVTLPDKRLWLDTQLIPLKKENGEIKSVLGISRDITERKHAEDQIKASLKEKEVLLQEIHHRVKNNLQVVSSLLNMQARAAKDKNAIDILAEARNRINTMALIHSQLYEGGDLSEINMKGFMDKLLVQLLQIHSAPDRKITPVVHAVECSLPISAAVPVGLILNELLTNAFKHAFVNRKEGKIEVCLSVSDEGVVSLTVSDDGVGLPEGFDINASKTLGLRVVKILAEEQLEGNLEIVSDNGTTFKLEFGTETNALAVS